MPPTLPNILADLPCAAAAEVFTPLLSRPGCRLERITSLGQTTPPDQPYLQPWDEWVLLLAGTARLSLAGTEHLLTPGTHLLIPAGTPHHITYTDPATPTVWLALHLQTEPGNGQAEPRNGG